MNCIKKLFKKIIPSKGIDLPRDLEENFKNYTLPEVAQILSTGGFTNFECDVKQDKCKNYKVTFKLIKTKKND
tara:strand:- start:120 stop:338 length:219 start_codon:yes stop_codon:yes gene_type:complete